MNIACSCWKWCWTQYRGNRLLAQRHRCWQRRRTTARAVETGDDADDASLHSGPRARALRRAFRSVRTVSADCPRTARDVDADALTRCRAETFLARARRHGACVVDGAAPSAD